MRYFDRPTETMPREQLQSLQLEKLRAMLDQLYGRNRFYTAKLDELRPYFTHAQFVVLPEFGHVGDVVLHSLQSVYVLYLILGLVPGLA